MRFREPNASEVLFYFDYQYLRRPLCWVVLNALNLLLSFFVPWGDGAWYFSAGIMSLLIIVCAIRINPNGVAGSGRIY